TSFNRNVRNIIINQHNFRSQSNSYPFPFDSPEVDFLIELQSKQPDLVDAAYRYLIGVNQNINTTSALAGTIMAYEFQNQDNSAIFNRRMKEKKSFDRLRSKFEGLSSDYENELTAYIAKLKEDFQTHIAELDEFKNAKEKSITDWFITEKGEIESFRKESKEDIENIQISYRNKVELQEPIKYWVERATVLKRKGNWLLGGIIGTSLLFAVGVYFLLWHTPADMLESIFDGDRTAAIRWSLVFVIFVSIFFVVARAFLRFMFSNFHLARDAEEREKLTY